MKKTGSILGLLLISNIVFFNNILLLLVGSIENANLQAIWLSISTTLTIALFISFFWRISSQHRIVNNKEHAKKRSWIFAAFISNFTASLFTFLSIHAHFYSQRAFLQILLQSAMFLFSLYCEIKFYKWYSETIGSMDEEMETEKDNDTVKCTKEEYTQVLYCILLSFLISIMNMDYFIFSSLNSNVFSLVILLANCILLSFFYSRLLQRKVYIDFITEKTIHINYYLCMTITLVQPFLQVMINDFLLWVFTALSLGIIGLAFSVIKVFYPIVRHSKKMQAYLEKF